MSSPVVLITGAAGGIGGALVTAFEDDGWSVISTDRAPLDRPAHVTADLRDCSDPDAPAFDVIVRKLRELTRGGIKAIVHNAAHQVVKPSQSITACDWDESLRINLSAPFWLSMAFADELAANHGSVLAISSIHSKLTKRGFVAYATSKAALSGMMRALSVDLGGRIRFNSISPAAISTGMLEAGFDHDRDAYEELERFHPVGRLGRPPEVAALATFLCSDAAGFITGSDIDISGGIGARLHDPR